MKLAKPLRKIVAGDPLRVSRFHDESGKFCGFLASLGLIPSAFSAIAARVRGRWLELPWWVWSAIRFTGRQVQQSDTVIELGSGYSSLWLARKCSLVVSVEQSALWIKALESMGATSLRRGRLKIVKGEARTGFMEALGVLRHPDVVVIDSDSRQEILRELLRRSELPKVIVYDDTDKSENRGAQELAAPHGYLPHVFRGFKPQCLHVCETTVFVKSNHSSRH